MRSFSRYNVFYYLHAVQYCKYISICRFSVWRLAFCLTILMFSSGTSVSHYIQFRIRSKKLLLVLCHVRQPTTWISSKFPHISSSMILMSPCNCPISNTIVEMVPLWNRCSWFNIEPNTVLLKNRFRRFVLEPMQSVQYRTAVGSI